MNTPIGATVLTAALAFATQTSHAAAIDGLLNEYRNQAANSFSVSRGEELWLTENGDRSCRSCHTADPKAQGKHQKTGKVIEPLAPSINSERLTSEKSVKKWLKRNCKWTLGRECSPQEKGDFLTWLQTQ